METRYLLGNFEWVLTSLQNISEEVLTLVNNTRKQKEYFNNACSAISFHSTGPMCGSRNYPYYPHGRSLEIPRGRGDLKAKLLEGQYEAKLEFPGGCGGAKQKTSHGGSVDIFWNYTIPLPYCERGNSADMHFSIGSLLTPGTQHLLTSLPRGAKTHLKGNASY